MSAILQNIRTRRRARNPKFRPGPPLASVQFVIAAIYAGHWLYSPPRDDHGRRFLVSPAWARNMTLATLEGYVQGGLLALRNEEIAE